MQPSKKSDLKTVSHEWGGESEGAAGKHSGFQNNPGFEMLEMLGSGPFLKLGVGVGVGGTHTNLQLPRQGGGKGRTEVVQPVGRGTRKGLPS